MHAPSEPLCTCGCTPVTSPHSQVSSAAWQAGLHLLTDPRDHRCSCPSPQTHDSLPRASLTSPRGAVAACQTRPQMLLHPISTMAGC